MEAANFSSHGFVQGRYGMEYIVCDSRQKFHTQGCIWFGCDPFAYTLPLLLAQIFIFAFLYKILSLILKPFRPSNLNCQLLVGLVLGRSCIGRNHSFYGRLFPPRGRLVLETIADVGFICHLFILGINVDIRIIKKMGRDAIAVGIASFLVPLVIGIVCIFYIPPLLKAYDMSHYSLLFLVTVNSMTSFPGITSHLSDLQILNSDIGRVATLASTVNDFCIYVLYITLSTVATVAQERQWKVMWSFVCNGTIFAVCLCIVRPVMSRFARSMAEGRRLKESHFLAIVIAALFCGFLTQSIGMPAGFGTFLFGAVLPDGPPLGTSLVQKLDSFCSGLLVPTKFSVAAFTVNLFRLHERSYEIVVWLIVFLGYLGKFTGVLISGLLFRIPFWDSISLSLIMCCKGVVEMSIFITLKEAGIIANEAFAILLIAMLIITGLARPLVLLLYDPSRRYAGKQTNSILYSEQNHLRILVCIHGEDNVASMLDLLAASNPTRESPISVFILNLVELKGRAAAVLERNVHRGRLHSDSKSDSVANAFDYLAMKNPGAVALQHFTSVAPYATMHSDICTIALDLEAHIIITPFHKHKHIDGSSESVKPGIRLVNLNVIKNAPSSVGILIDRSYLAGDLQPLIAGSKFFRIFVLFLGGADDREALAYGCRMIGNPNLSLTLVCLSSLNEAASTDVETDSSLDGDMIRHFRANTIGNPLVQYREEVAKDAVGTTRVLRSLEGACDLCIVGRHHRPESPLTQGMITEWSECPEFGALGDMLAGSDFRFSSLVVKQQAVEEPGFWKQKSFGSSVELWQQLTSSSKF